MTFGRTELLVLVGLVVLRVTNALTIKTFFQPDEYFQVLEPAWKLAFGADSGAWITWEWKEQLRSSLHPILFSRLYLLVDHLATASEFDEATRAQALIYAPKILQALFAAAADFSIWTLARSVYTKDSRTSWSALILTILSPWQWFCSTRTFANCVETLLTVVALNFWAWSWFVGEAATKSSLEERKGSLKTALLLAALACILRPTNLIIWATITLSLLLRYGDVHKVWVLSRDAALCGGAVFAISIAIDTTYFGELTFPPLKFLYFNIVQSLAVFYGRNRPDYYFTEGLPLLLTTGLPFAAFGLWRALFSRGRALKSEAILEWVVLQTLTAAILSTVIVLSLISHKEVRFIYPLLPLLIVIAAKPFARFFSRPTPIRSTLFGVWALLGIAIACYASFVHQRGVIDVMHYLRHEQEAHFGSAAGTRNITVGFLMPCHSTPWRSHLVYSEIDAWALTCEPPLHVPLAERSTYLDEADVFYESPSVWLQNNMVDQKMSVEKAKEGRAWPEYLVFFEQLEPEMQKILAGTKYRQCWRGFNTHFHDDWRRQGDVVVWCTSSS